MRKVISDINQMVDIISSIRGGAFVTIGYINAAKIGKTAQNVNLDKFGETLNKHRTPGDDETYNALSQFQQGPSKLSNKFPYAGVVKFSIFQVNWLTEDNYRKNYTKYAEERDKIITSYGATPQHRDSYDEKLNYNKGVSGGITANTQGKLYAHQNRDTFRYIDQKYFLVNNDGAIKGAISKKALEPLLKDSNYVDGMSTLKKIEASAEQMKEYAAKIDNLKFKPMALMYDSILFIIASVNGEKIAYINTNLQNKVGSGKYVVPIQPQSFIEMANAMYKEADSSLQESVKQFNLAKSYISETVKRVLNEVNGYTLDDEDYMCVNPEDSDSYNNCYVVKIWSGNGYHLSCYKVYANHEQEALEKCVAWLEDNDPSMLQDEIYQQYIENGDDEEELDSVFLYVDATTEGALQPHYIYLENLDIYKTSNTTLENKIKKRVKNLVKETVLKYFS